MLADMNLNELPLIVTIKSGVFNNPIKGLVTPIAFLDEEIKPINPIDFPNGAIFISKSFDLLDSKFDEGELFLLNSYKPTDDDPLSGDTYTNNLNYHKFFSIGEWAKPLPNGVLLPILDMELPDVATGKVNNIDVNLPKSQFFIQKSDDIYGPFTATNESEIGWVVEPVRLTHIQEILGEYVGVFSYQVLKSEKFIVNLTINSESKKFISNFKNIGPDLLKSTFDFINDTKLITLFAKADFGRGNQQLSKAEIKKLLSSIESTSKQKHIQNNNPRLERVKKSLSAFLQQADYGEELIHRFLSETTDGKQVLKKYIEDNRGALLNKVESDLKAEMNKLKELLKNETNDLERQKKQVAEALKIEQTRLSLFTKEAEERRNQLKLEVSKIDKVALAKEEESLLSEIEKHRAELSEIKDYQSLKKQKDYLELSIEELRIKKDQAVTIVDQTLETLRSKTLINKMAENKIISDLLNNKFNKETTSDEPNLLNNFSIHSSTYLLTTENDHDNRVEYIKYITNKMNEDYGKQFSNVEIANILICTSQSFLTIFSGFPGTGKTSTALRYAKNLLLTNNKYDTTDNFLTISVGKSWTTSRDLIGFFNTLKGQYQPSKTGLYTFLQKESSFLKLVLLDEANLSNIEHYWSDFLIMCDPEGKKYIETGSTNPSEKTLNITNNIRFIGTLNNDATTEKLSPRLIDRVPVILFDANSNVDEAEVFTQFNGAVSFDAINNAFNISISEASLTVIEEKMLDTIQEILIGSKDASHRIHISARKKNNIIRYCYIANKLDDIYQSDIPLDWAVSQYVLPLIEGNGQSFKNKIIRLKDKLEEYKFYKSMGILENILNEGNEYSDSYSFF